MGLLDGGIRKMAAQALSGVYVDAVLYRQGTDGGEFPTEYDEDGFPVDPEPDEQAGEAIKVQFDRVTQRMAAADGYAVGDQRILVLAEGVAPFATDAEIATGGETWRVVSVEQDPARAYYEVRARRG